MKKFDIHEGLVVPLDRSNIDTDAIIPKQFLSRVSRDGFGENLFHEWRYLDEEGKQNNPDFTLNQARYKGASILLARENFGCGSSREHAPWALDDYGFRSIIAESFADIFYSNALNNGILPIKLKKDEIEELFCMVYKNEGLKLKINLADQSLKAPRKTYHFDIEKAKKDSLLEGLDFIALTLKHEAQIRKYEEKIPSFLR